MAINIPFTFKIGIHNSNKIFNRATALAITISKVSRNEASISSTLAVIIVTFFKSNCWTTSFKKFILFVKESIMVNSISGKTIFKGIAGNPAPEPTSQTFKPLKFLLKAIVNES